jgi:hypothetical protein
MQREEKNIHLNKFINKYTKILLLIPYSDWQNALFFQQCFFSFIRLISLVHLIKYARYVDCEYKGWIFLGLMGCLDDDCSGGWVGRHRWTWDSWVELRFLYNIFKFMISISWIRMLPNKRVLRILKIELIHNQILVFQTVCDRWLF